MTAHYLISRRLLLRDMGKAGLAVMVMGLAACGGGEAEDDVTAGAGHDEGHAWHRVSLGFVSAYILYRGGEATIVDTGVGGSEGDIERGLTEIGLGWGDVGALVVTHLHGDHQGSLPAVIAATSDVLPWFAGAADLDGIDAPTEGQAVGDGDTVGGGLQILESPGHTAGHISVLDRVAAILVTGDALNGAEGGVAGPNPGFTDDMGQANLSVAKLAGFEYEVALFGHGEPVLAGASGLVAELAASLG